MSRRYIIFNRHCYYCHVFVFIPMMTQVPDGPKRQFFCWEGTIKRCQMKWLEEYPRKKKKTGLLIRGWQDISSWYGSLWFTYHITIHVVLAVLAGSILMYLLYVLKPISSDGSTLSSKPRAQVRYRYEGFKLVNNHEMLPYRQWNGNNIPQIYLILSWNVAMLTGQ